MTDQARRLITALNAFMIFFWLIIQAFAVKNTIRFGGDGREQIFFASLMLIIFAFSIGVDFAIMMARKGHVKGLKADDVEESDKAGDL